MQDLINILKSVAKLLNQDVTAICDYLTNPNFRIAVFGPFNHGKSTLLNAMLGSKTLPIDLLPTTGAAITVKYGTDMRTRILLSNGCEVYRSGTDILKEFALLDGDRRMRGDVTSVEVFYPHPFLETGIEFLDLPGTNDREAQDNLVKEQLLGADLVVQLLDARKLMTLGERENLRDWLLDRGIKTVIFVVNFINLLEPEEQKEVQNRLRFVAESFRADIPAGFSNLYRVDALPALRARIKGDTSLANSSGLVEFETALQNIATILKHNRNSVVAPRVQVVTKELQLLLKAKITGLENGIKKITDKNNAANEIKKRAEGLIKQGFYQSMGKLRSWLELDKLRQKYQSDAAVALAKENFSTWENTFRTDLNNLQLAVVKWLDQANEFFLSQQREDLILPLPKHPQLTLPPRTNNTGNFNETGSLAVGSGIGWLVGGPLGAAVLGSIAYLTNKTIQEQDNKASSQSYHQQVATLCLNAVDEYLNTFSRESLSILNEYERKAQSVIRFIEPNDTPDIIHKRQQLQQWQNSLHQLNQALLNNLGISTPNEFQTEVTQTNAQTVYRSQGVGTKETIGTPKQNQIPVIEAPTEQQLKPSVAEVEAKFRNWELDEEIAQMKANMGMPGNEKQPTPTNKNTNKAHAYIVLGLQEGATVADIKLAYRKLVKQWHPDLFTDKAQQKQAQEKMHKINEAYNSLL
ncbi:dynamin family protein [Calothrix sp. NIES-4071]|nr:dynamin family protein [Calothrix sp. NIES-4071]BAZ54647.1 dynamin family protein [Calothrix sp. NIES-4105]